MTDHFPDSDPQPGSPTFRADQPEPRSRPRRRGLSRALRVAVVGLTTVLLLAVMAAAWVRLVYLSDLPAVPTADGLWSLNRAPGITFLDRNGVKIATRGPRHGQKAALIALPAYVPKAFLAAEDRRFYEHGPVDVYGMGRAAHAIDVHRSVLVETPVLGGEEGLGDIGGQGDKGRFLAMPRSAGGDLDAVAVQEGDPRRAVQRPQAVGGWHSGKVRQIDQPDPGGRHHRQQQHGGQADDRDPQRAAQPPPARPGARLRLVGAEGRGPGLRVRVGEMIRHEVMLAISVRGSRASVL